VKEKVSRKWKNWYQNEVDEEIKGADSRNKVKHTEMSDQLFLEKMMKRWPSKRGAVAPPQLGGLKNFQI